MNAQGIMVGNMTDFSLLFKYRNETWGGRRKAEFKYSIRTGCGQRHNGES